MSNIYSAKFMNEATAYLADKVFKRPVNETYLFSTLDILREMNSMVNKNTEKLYIQIAEAESKESENKIFADYFYQFKNIFQNFANKVNEMKSRMVISVENKVETWGDLISDDNYIACFDKEFSYSGWNFSHVQSAEYPRLNLYKIYQKEFDYLGHLMQDNSIDASPSAKMKVIATVCNNFAVASGDKSWIQSLICDMVDVDEKEISRSYSECIYNALRDKYDITVDKGMLYTCKESLMDYEDAIDAAVKMCDALLKDLDKVAENISSYLFRNEDKKLKIKTDTDGIIDRDYRLDTYSMNQLDLFLKNKINQMRKVLNVYCIALSIKFDTAVDYIQQNIDILKMAKENMSNEVGGIEDEEDNNIIDDVENGVNDDDLDDSQEDIDDDSDDDVEFSGEDDVEDKQSIEEEPDDLDDDLDDVDEANDVIDYEGEDFEESYLFESELFELEMMQEAYDMHINIRRALLLEEETPANNTQSTGNTSETPNLQKVANKNEPNVWQKIIEKLIALWNKFKEAVFERTKAKIEYLKKNAKYIETEVKGEVKLQYGVGVKLANLTNMKKIPDLNYAALEKDLESEEAFINAHFAIYKKDGKSISDAIKEEFLGKPYENMTPVSGIQPGIKEAYEFCVNYPAKVAPIKAQMDLIQRAQAAAKNVSNVQESASNNDFRQYFTEMEGKAEDVKGNKSKKLTVYFKVCSQVLAAEMTVYQKWFNELYSFCKWYIKAAGGPSPAGSSEENKQADTNTQQTAAKESTVEINEQEFDNELLELMLFECNSELLESVVSESDNDTQFYSEAFIIPNKNKLDDPEYVKNLIKKINDIDQTEKDIIKILSILDKISAIIVSLSIIGIPIALIMLAISKVKYKIIGKITDLTTLKSYRKTIDHIDTCVKKLEAQKSDATATDKKKIDSTIKQLNENKEKMQKALKDVEFKQKLK